MRRPSRTAWLAAAALAAVAGVGVLTERTTAPSGDSFASGDVTGGGYAAFALLLEREGVRTASFDRRPIELDRAEDTLVSAQPSGANPTIPARTPREFADLVAWVERGGRLVYLGRNAALAGEERDLLHLPPLTFARASARSMRGTFAPLVRSLSGVGNARITFVPHRNASELLGDARGAVAVRYALGAGEVIAVGAPELFTNRGLAKTDVARLAYLLARPREAGGVVAFDDALHGELVDRPWYRALAPAEVLGLAIAALASVLGILGAALRFGLPVRLRAEREPTSAEFIAALAALRERTHAREPTRVALIKGVLARAARVGRMRDPRVRAIETSLAVPARTDDDLIASARLVYALREDVRHDGFGDQRRSAFTRRTRRDRRR